MQQVDAVMFPVVYLAFVRALLAFECGLDVLPQAVDHRFGDDDLPLGKPNPRFSGGFGKRISVSIDRLTVEQFRVLDETPKGPLVSVLPGCQLNRELWNLVAGGGYQKRGSPRIRQSVYLPESYPDQAPIRLLRCAHTLENRLSVGLWHLRPVKVKETLVGGEELFKECVRRFLNDDARIKRLRHNYPARQRGPMCFYRLQVRGTPDFPGVDQKQELASNFCSRHTIPILPRSKNITGGNCF